MKLPTTLFLLCINFNVIAQMTPTEVCAYDFFPTYAENATSNTTTAMMTLMFPSEVSLQPCAVWVVRGDKPEEDRPLARQFKRMMQSSSLLYELAIPPEVPSLVEAAMPQNGLFEITFLSNVPNPVSLEEGIYVYLIIGGFTPLSDEFFAVYDVTGILD